MTEHTPTPWRLRSTGNMGNLIEADSGKRMDSMDDGYRTVASYQECCASDLYAKQEANRTANGEFIVKAVNNHTALVKALNEIAWMDEHLSTDTAREMMNIARAALESVEPRSGRRVGTVVDRS